MASRMRNEQTVDDESGRLPDRRLSETPGERHRIVDRVWALATV
jgi:hypothetical protein